MVEVFGRLTTRYEAYCCICSFSSAGSRPLQHQNSSSIILSNKTLYMKICPLCSVVFCLQNEVDWLYFQVFYNSSDRDSRRLLSGYHFQMNQVWYHHFAGSCFETESYSRQCCCLPKADLAHIISWELNVSSLKISSHWRRWGPWGSSL